MFYDCSRHIPLLSARNFPCVFFRIVLRFILSVENIKKVICHVHEPFQTIFQRLHGAGFDAAASDKISVHITISELTERAGVSRMTYYRNYNSMDEIFISYLKDLVDAYRQDVAAWPDKGNYNDYRNMLHCYEYFDHYREFIACLVNTGLGHLLLQALDSYILDTYYTEKKGRDFYYTLRAFSGSLYNIYVTWIMENSMESAEEIVSIICQIYS